jgi:hypothetical protein
MVRPGSFIRDLALVGLAAAAGWWWRGGSAVVLAQHASSSSARDSSAGVSSLAFQMTGTGPQAALTVYNPANQTLYVYSRIGEGNSYLNCSYSFHISRPGAPIERENCPVGDQLPQH